MSRYHREEGFGIVEKGVWYHREEGFGNIEKGVSVLQRRGLRYYRGVVSVL